MAITAAHLIDGVDDTQSTSDSTTASISPGTSKLDIVSVSSGSSVTTPNTPTVTGAGGTWTQIATAVDTANSRRITLFRDLSASPGSGALTISFAGQAQGRGVAWSVDEFSGTDTTGTHGSGAIVQSVSSGTALAATTGITETLAALGSANNAAMGFVRNNGTNQVITVGSGFTQLEDNTSSALGTTINNEWAINNTAVAWTWASQTIISVAMAIEIKAGGIAAPFVIALPPSLFGTMSYLDPASYSLNKNLYPPLLPSNPFVNLWNLR